MQSVAMTAGVIFAPDSSTPLVPTKNISAAFALNTGAKKAIVTAPQFTKPRTKF